MGLFFPHCLRLGGLVGWWQNDAIREWYPHLVKPALTPPNAAFPIAWSIIYLCMGLSAGLVLTSASPLRRRVMALWFAQLGFNVLWSILFFVCRSPLLGMIDIAARHSRRRLHCAERENPGRSGVALSFRTSAGYSSPPISTPASSRPTARALTCRTAIRPTRKRAHHPISKSSRRTLGT
ncbi:MAG: TspO/MBR family protein [Alistipes sp.]